MDVTQFDAALVNKISATSAINPNAATVINQSVRQGAMYTAIRQYSRYQMTQKRMGAGTVFQQAAPGQTYLNVAGGLFSVGMVITIGYSLSTSETATITAISRNTGLPYSLGTPVQLTLSAGLANSHYPGEIVWPPTIGLNLSSLYDQYTMPNDFVAPEFASFGVASGQRTSYHNVESFYGQLYTQATLLSGIGIGYSQNFGGYGGVSYLLFGGVLPAPNTAYQGGLQYQFRASVPVLMTVFPQPLIDQTLDFFYWAVCQPYDIPDGDIDAVLDYAFYECMKTAASDWLLRSVDYSDGDVTQSASKTSTILLALGENAKKRFDDVVRYRPFAVSG